ncbi:1,6-anhydro-N-acetylmuramyl-L-alanine amidase AmpD [Isoalcanivorax beigongshangi]|uniref:1,6-anhydro-N-acetylmuramyl-L-alanine amidase AmpD n=1 Tax=Isoalcanivorax beigongshangi TaxID=3238810 RepID=A0ABV4AIC5_9GAMM
MTLTFTAHWLDQALQRRSPNANERPDPADLSLIVIHNISLPPGQFGGEDVERLFLNQLDHSADPYFAGLRGLEVSAHFYIRRHGDIRQYVACDRRAWHAGQSSWQGRSGCNDFSIGIELEGTDHTPYTNAQYRSVVALVRALLLQYPTLSEQAIVGHSDIAPGRKTDPGAAFDWPRFHGLLAAKEENP